jgi:hypothetical protein
MKQMEFGYDGVFVREKEEKRLPCLWHLARIVVLLPPILPFLQNRHLLDATPGRPNFETIFL